MGNQSRNTLNEVGTIYMSSMSEQISLHFETTMNLRLSQVQALTTTTPPEQNLEEEGLRQNLAFNAQARGFDYLGFYLEDQTLDTIYGQPATIIDPDPFYASICEKKEKIAVATNSAGEKIVLLAFPCNYSLSGGRSSIALVAGLPVDYINTTLSLDKTDDSLAYSYIIRMDGTFVIRGSDVVRESYFDGSGRSSARNSARKPRPVCATYPPPWPPAKIIPIFSALAMNGVTFTALHWLTRNGI